MLFYFISIVHLAMLAGVLFSIILPDKRIWPPPHRHSWKFLLTWLIFFGAVALTIVLTIFTWNTWWIPFKIRYFVGLPIALIGGLFAFWGIAVLGLNNTSGKATSTM